jgi:MYXO-CTERM domain-containing protein
MLATAVSASAALLAPSTVLAQGTAGTGTTGTGTTGTTGDAMGTGTTGSMAADQQTTTTPVEDDGPDYGWIGLLGLAGLAGLRKKDHHVVAHTTTTGTSRDTMR